MLLTADDGHVGCAADCREHRRRYRPCPAPQGRKSAAQDASPGYTADATEPRRGERNGSYVELVISASKSLRDKPRQEIIDLALAELREFFPAAREANLIKSTVIKEVNATFSPTSRNRPLPPRLRNTMARHLPRRRLDRHRLARHHGKRRPQRLHRRRTNHQSRRSREALPRPRPPRHRPDAAPWLIRLDFGSFGETIGSTQTAGGHHHEKPNYLVGRSRLHHCCLLGALLLSHRPQFPARPFGLSSA